MRKVRGGEGFEQRFSQFPMFAVHHERARFVIGENRRIGLAAEFRVDQRIGGDIEHFLDFPPVFGVRKGSAAFPGIKSGDRAAKFFGDFADG